MKKFFNRIKSFIFKFILIIFSTIITLFSLEIYLYLNNYAPNYKKFSYKILNETALLNVDLNYIKKNENINIVLGDSFTKGEVCAAKRKDFVSQISGVKNFAKTGAFVTFKNDSPQMFQGVDTLNTDLGTKITIGDGGLFSQPGQAVTNADKPYEYGSSQNRLAVISTPAGLFFVSQNQGKIFNYGEGLKEISQIGLKWWFALFLKYKLTQFYKTKHN
jgi:hypothetical protein